jgi:hypothetical protein
MQLADSTLNHHEVIIKTTSIHEGTLMSPHQLWDKRCQSIGNHFGYPLGDTMDQVDRPEVSHLFDVGFPREDGDERILNRSESMTVKAR